MQRTLVIFALIIALLLAGHAAWWFSSMGSAREQVQASLDAYAAQVKQTNPNVTLSYAAVRSAGYPFSTYIVIDKPHVEFIDMFERYILTTDAVLLSPGYSGLEVEISQPVAAIYRPRGEAEETYSFGVNPMPQSYWREGKQEEELLTMLHVDLPAELMVEAEMGNESRAIHFDFPLRQIRFDPIPTDIAWPVKIWVLTLREAVVYN